MTDQRLLCTSLARQSFAIEPRFGGDGGAACPGTTKQQAGVGSTLRSPRTRNATQRMLPYRNAVGRLSAAQTVLTDTRFRSWPLERCEPLTARTLRAHDRFRWELRGKLRLSQRGPALPQCGLHQVGSTPTQATLTQRCGCRDGAAPESAQHNGLRNAALWLLRSHRILRRAGSTASL